MRNKTKLIILQVFIAIILISTSVYAAIDTTIGVKVSKSILYRGDTVDVTLSLSNVKSDKKITNVEGYINYDKDVLETITYDSIVKDENKKVTIGDETLPVEDASNVQSSSAFVLFNGSPESDNDAKILIDFNNGLTKDSDLITIKFKVKSNASIGDVENAIKYSFVVKSNEEKTEEITKNVNLTVKETIKDENKNETKNETKNESKLEDTVGKVDNKNVNKNTNKNTNTNTKNNAVNNTNTTDNSVSGTKLPATGAKIFIIPAIVLIALAYISYNRYIRMRGI